MLSWFKNRVKRGNSCKYKFKQRKKDSWRNITTLLNQDGVPGGGPVYSSGASVEQSSVSTGRRPHSLSEDSDNSSTNQKGSSSSTSNTKHVRFQLSLDSTRAYLSFDSGEDTCSVKSNFSTTQNREDEIQQNTFSDEGSEANSGVNSNHSSEESGHTTNSSGLGSSIIDNSSSAGILTHSKSMKITANQRPIVQPIKQTKLQRNKSTIGGYSVRNRQAIKKSNSISYRISSDNPNGGADSQDVRKLYEQRLKQFQQQYPSIDPARQHLGRQILGLNRINSNPTQHHINLVRTMSTNAKLKTNFRDELGCSSVLYA